MQPFQNDASHAYPDDLCRLLLLLLRTHPAEQQDYDLPLPQDVSVAVDDLYRAVHVSERQYDAGTVRECVDLVLRVVFMREWEPTDDNRLPDPVVRSVLLSVLNRDGRWKSAKLLTPMLAKLKRMVVSVYVKFGAMARD